MTGNIDRIKQDLATMEQAIGLKQQYGPQHVGMYLGFGIGGMCTLLLALFTSLLETDPTRVIMVPLLLGTPYILARLMGPRPFRLSMLETGNGTKAESNVAAVMIGLAIIGFAALLTNTGVPYPIVSSVGMMLSALYLFTLAWGRPQHVSLLVIAAGFFIMAVTYPFLADELHTELFGLVMAITGFGAAAIIHKQLRTDQPDVATH